MVDLLVRAELMKHTILWVRKSVQGSKCKLPCDVLKLKKMVFFALKFFSKCRFIQNFFFIFLKTNG